MKCLTVFEPWGAAIIWGPKPIENRTTKFNHRGDLAIHAGRSMHWFTPEAISLLAHTWPGFPADGVAGLNYLRQRTMGRVIGVVTVVDCVYLPDLAPGLFDAHEQRFASGPWCLKLAHRRILRKPFWLRGQQGMFNIPDDLIEKAEPVPLAPTPYEFKWQPQPQSVIDGLRAAAEAFGGD